MSVFKMRALIFLVVAGSLGISVGSVWGREKAADPNAAKRNPVDPEDGPVGLSPAKKTLQSIGRPLSLGPTFPESPAPTQEQGEKQQTRIRELIPQLDDDRLETRDQAMRELESICSHMRAPLERVLNHKSAEIVRRVKRILAQFPLLTHVIVDAANEPIPYAKVIVTLTPAPSSAQNPNAVPDVEARVVGDWTDEYGRISIPKVDDNGVSSVVQIQHPDYGHGRCQVLFWNPNAALRFPLVRQKSPLTDRAVSGIVAAPNGQPVAGAIIQCNSVRTAGEGLINGIPFRGDALTDDQGRFRYYLPNDNPDGSRGDIIPPNSRYEFIVTKPDDESYFPVAVAFSNGEPVRIELPKPTEHRRFRFQNAAGKWLETPEQLRSLYVERRDENRRAVVLDVPSLVRGRTILDGAYSAILVDNGKVVNFEPLIVGKESPEELIFRLPGPITYRGRVLHGVTRQPVANAIVIGWNATARNNLALLSNDDWKRLELAPSNPPLDHPAMRLLGKYYGVQGLVRTNEDGQFEIVRQPDQEFYGIMAFNRDSVPFKVRIVSLKPNAERQIEVDEFPLFPAAKVMVRPVFDGDRLPIWPNWLPTSDDQPEWFTRFQVIQSGSDREFEYGHWLTINELQPIYVPAGVRMRLKFDTPYNDEWVPVTTDAPIRLDAGASQEIGDLQFKPSLRAEVQVVNQAGKPVEGFAIRRNYHSTNSWCVAHNTDETGTAFFHVHPNSQGQFRVTDLNGPAEVSQAMNLSVKFQTGESDPKEPFRIKVTDEQIALLRKGK